MKKTVAFLSIVAVLVPASALGMPRVTKTTTTDKMRYVDGEVVTIKFTNETQSSVTLGDTWRIVDSSDGQEQSQYVWPEEERTVEPGEERVWYWEQNQGCYGICQNVKYGEPSGPGKYYVEIPWSEGDGPILLPFTIGQYFTIGFTYNERVKFVVFSNRPEVVEQMEQEAAAEDKTKLVAGRVMGPRRYNDRWEFSLSPGSIEVAEVAIEVCDGRPGYVQRHYDEWKGETWCPWSSFVEKVGR